MRLLPHAAALALACAAVASAQSGRVVKRPEPAAAPTPAQQQEAAPQQAGGRAAAGKADRDDAGPELDEEGNRVYRAREVDRRAALLSRPEPVYPRLARSKGVHGVVVLRAVLAASGRVEKITVVRGLPDGVTEEAVKVTRRIKFRPAEREGRKVSQSAVFEYNFNIY